MRRRGLPVYHRAVAIQTKKRGVWSWWYLLFVLQFLVALWPPLYNKTDPELFGVPFFYWFQLAWILVCAVLTGVVYFVTER